MKPSITGSKKGSLPKMYHPVPAIGSKLFGSNFTIFSSLFLPYFPHLFSILFLCYDPVAVSTIWHRRAPVRAAL
jgi:hypothetical protein